MTKINVTPKVAFMVLKILDYASEMPVSTTEQVGKNCSEADWTRLSEFEGDLSRIARSIKE